jgi:hypothetical protein
MRRRPTKPKVPEVPLETWRELYFAADELCGLALWECMGDAELLGLEHPHTGEPMLGAVLGGLGEVFGFAIYYGPKGLRWVLEVALGDVDEMEMIENFFEASALKVQFVAKSALTPEEKRRVKKLGFQPAGKGARRWPTFESMRPGCVPWHLDGTEAELLLDALPRLTALGAAVRPLYEEDEVPLADGFAFWPKDRALGEPLRREEVDWRRLSVPPEPAPKPFAADEPTEDALKRLAQAPALVLEVDAFAGREAIAEGERPWFTKMGVAVEGQSGMIAGMEMGTSPDEPLEMIAGRALLAAMHALHARPRAVRLRQARMRQALEPLADRLGIRLELRNNLSMVAEFRAALPGQFGFARR